MSRKICVVTGTRAEYGLLFWLMKSIQENDFFRLQIIATGMHLSPEFGLTYRQIEKDGFKLDKKIEMLVSSDTAVGIAKSMGLAQISFAEAFSELDPDLIILLGDRFELLPAAATALVAKIPIAHLHGGEITAGAFDDSLRHCLTKLSHLHFTSTAEYRRRVIQLGEDPGKVFNVGALGIENIKRLNLLSRTELEQELQFELGPRCIVATFHPATLGNSSAESQFKSLLNAIKANEQLRVIFTKANADTGGRAINRMIDQFVAEMPQRSIAFTSMGQLRYLSAVKHVDAVVGNSSSGIVEAPSLKTPTVDIGDRQRGRVNAASIIHCEPSRKEIGSAINRALESSFKAKTIAVKNPYEKKHTLQNILTILKSANLDNILMKKFYDLPSTPVKDMGPE